MEIKLGDVLVMKKPHPCGEKKWLVLRTRADFFGVCQQSSITIVGAVMNRPCGTRYRIHRDSMRICTVP